VLGKERLRRQEGNAAPPPSPTHTPTHGHTSTASCCMRQWWEQDSASSASKDTKRRSRSSSPSVTDVRMEVTQSISCAAAQAGHSNDTQRHPRQEIGGGGEGERVRRGVRQFRWSGQMV
jgi:hypothetical protein